MTVTQSSTSPTPEEVSQLALSLADLRLVCRDGSLLWNTSHLAASSPLLSTVLAPVDSVLVLGDFPTLLVSSLLSLLCGLQSCRAEM